MTTHQLKINKDFFEAVYKGVKTFEIRFNDRDYKVLDTVVLNEIDSNRVFTGRSLSATITYISDYEQKPGYVVFGIKKVQ